MGIVKIAKSQDKDFEGFAPYNKIRITIDIPMTIYMIVKIVIHTELFLRKTFDNC